MPDHIKLTHLKGNPLSRDEPRDLSISPALPRESDSRSDHLEQEQDTKKNVFIYQPATLSHRPSNISRITSDSSSSRHTGPSLSANKPQPTPTGIRKIGFVLVRHLKFVGPGLVSSVAYFDP